MGLSNILLAWKIKHLLKGIIAKAGQQKGVITEVYHIDKPRLAIPKGKQDNHFSHGMVLC